MNKDKDFYSINVYNCLICNKKFFGTNRYPKKYLFKHIINDHGIKKNYPNETLDKKYWKQLDSIPGKYIFECKKCGKKYSSNSKELLNNKRNKHLKIHNIDYKHYYDIYIRKDGEGYCKTCGKETTFRRGKKYRKYCSK